MGGIRRSQPLRDDTGVLGTVRRHFWAVFFLAALIVVCVIWVRSWKSKHPGSMTVIESQAMDMTVMRPPVGAVPVATEVVGSGDFSASVTYTGTVVPYQEQVIYPRIDGAVKSIPVYDGDTVVPGQLLASLDSPDISAKVAEARAGNIAVLSEVPVARADASRMRAERNASEEEAAAANSELKSAQAEASAMEKGVTQRKRDVKAARAQVDYWRAEIARMKNLLASGAVSQQEYDSEKAQAASAEADLEAKQAMVEEAKARLTAASADVEAKQSMLRVALQNVDAAKAAYAGAGEMIKQKSAMAGQSRAMITTAEAIDAYRYIRAPFAGRVTKRYVSPGQFVTQSTALLSVVQVSRIRLQANVADADSARIRIGAPVSAEFPTHPDVRTAAVITAISPSADTSTRTTLIEALVGNPGGVLFPGESVTMRIGVSGGGRGISVPSSSIVTKNDSPAVWVVTKSAAKGKTQYTCTMHPQIIRNKPGKCPICLMALVPTKSTGDSHAHVVAVTVGARSGDRVQILSGLSEGNEVIYRGNVYLNEGDEVFPTAWTSDGPAKLPPAPGGGSDMPEMPGMKTDTPSESSRAGASKPAQSVGKTAVSKKTVLYTCPMHPEVTSTKPGQTCPKCGMRLEKKK